MMLAMTVLDLCLAFLLALVPFWLACAIGALVRMQWKVLLLALGGIALPFASFAAFSYLLHSKWVSGDVDPATRDGVLGPMMAGVTNSMMFGLLFGLIKMPVVTFLDERRASCRGPWTLWLATVRCCLVKWRSG